MRGDVAGLNNTGIGRVDVFPRLLKHHMSNAIRSRCRKRVEFGKGFLHPFRGEDAIKVAI